MDWAKFQDPVSHTCLAGTVVAYWSLKQEAAGSSHFTVMTKDLGKIQLDLSCCLIFTLVTLTLRSNTKFQWRIQDFPEVGVPTPKSFCKSFAENCMKMKEFGSASEFRGSDSSCPIGTVNVWICPCA